MASHATWSAHPLTGSRNRFEFLLLIGMLLVGIGFGFALGSYSPRTPTPSQEASEAVNIDAVVEQIISVKSNGDPNAKNKRSSAMGLGSVLRRAWARPFTDPRPIALERLFLALGSPFDSTLIVSFQQAHRCSRLPMLLGRGSVSEESMSLGQTQSDADQEHANRDREIQICCGCRSVRAQSSVRDQDWRSNPLCHRHDRPKQLDSGP